MFKDNIFREYDIRGVYQIDFDDTFAFNLGKIYGCLLKKDFLKDFDLKTDRDQKNHELSVSVGWDARLSSPAIAEALMDGLAHCGIKVFNLGFITSPMSYFSLFHMDLSGGIMVTGSHNPPEYNGFKLSKSQSTFFGNQIREMRSLLKKQNFDPPLQKKGVIEDYDISQDYVDRHKKEFHQIKDPGLVLDCGNGSAGVIARRLYESVGLQPEILFEKPDGTFPNHHPDPTVESNTEDLKKRVLFKKASIGLGFDGDADRLGVVDEKGQFIPGDEIMMIFARDLLKKHKKIKIIGDVKCSDRLYRDIEERGGRAIMWKTGHSLIKNKIKTEKAFFGGELSGHFFFADRNKGYDDALYAGLRLVEILGQTGQTVDELLSGIPKSFNTPEIRIDVGEEKKEFVVTRLKEIFLKNSSLYKMNTLDGIRVGFGNGWALVRASNTQPAITLRFESDTEESLEKIKTHIMGLVEPLL